MDEKEVSEKLNVGLHRFIKEERKLLESGVREDSLAHKVAEHLKPEFEGFDVDAEYDKMHIDGVPYQKKYLGSGGRKYAAIPDIIIHRRQTMDNYVAIEIKRAGKRVGRSKDFEKLNAYKFQLGYRFGVFMEIGLKDSEPFYKFQFV